MTQNLSVNKNGKSVVRRCHKFYGNGLPLTFVISKQQKSVANHFHRTYLQLYMDYVTTTYLLCNAFEWYTMEHPTSDLY